MSGFLLVQGWFDDDTATGWWFDKDDDAETDLASSLVAIIVPAEMWGRFVAAVAALDAVRLEIGAIADLDPDDACRLTPCDEWRGEKAMLLGHPYWGLCTDCGRSATDHGIDEQDFDDSGGLK